MFKFDDMIAKKSAFPGLKIQGNNNVVEEIMKRVRNNMKRGTTADRKSLDAMKALLVVNNKSIEKLDANNFSEVLSPNDPSKAMDVVNKGVFYVLAPGLTEASAAQRYKNFGAALKAATEYVGTKVNKEYASFRKLLKTGREKEALDLDQDTDTLFIHYINAPISKMTAQTMAEAFMRESYDAWDAESGNDLWGIESDKLKLVYKEGSQEIGKFDILGRKSLKYIFKYENPDGFEHQYTLVTVKVTIDQGPSLNPISRADPKVGISEALLDENQKPTVAVKSTTASTRSTKTGSKPILDLERELVKEGITIFDYGHIVSAGYAKLKNMETSLASALGKIDSSVKGWQKLKNMTLTIGNIAAVARKLDSILEDMDTAQGVTTKDVINVLLTENINADFLYYTTKVGGIVTTTKGPSRVMTIDVDGKVETEILATVERRGFNAQSKGKVTAMLLAILDKELKGNFDKVLSQPDIIAMLADSNAYQSGSDSLMSAAIKTIFGARNKIDKGSGKKVRSSVNKKVSFLSAARGVAKIKSVYKKGKRDSKNPSVKKAVRSPAPTTFSGNNQVDNTSFVGLINSAISQEVASRMTAPGLENRTGRFSRSVRANLYKNNTIFYSYMYSPYEVFSKTRGSYPWNSVVERDPATLIEAAMRSILAEYDPTRASLLKFAEG